MSNKVLVAIAAVVILAGAGWLFWESRRPAPAPSSASGPKTAAPTPPGFVRHHVKEMGFSIACPKEWDPGSGMRSEGPHAAFGFCSPREGRTQITVHTVELPRQFSLEEYASAYTDDRKKQVVGCRLHEETAAVIDGTDARKIVYFHQLDVDSIRNLSYVVVRGRRAYVIFFMAPEKNFGRLGPVFEQITRSFRFEN